MRPLTIYLMSCSFKELSYLDFIFLLRKYCLKISIHLRLVLNSFKASEVTRLSAFYALQLPMKYSYHSVSIPS